MRPLQKSVPCRTMRCPVPSQDARGCEIEERPVRGYVGSQCDKLACTCHARLSCPSTGIFDGMPGDLGRHGSGCCADGGREDVEGWKAADSGCLCTPSSSRAPEPSEWSPGRCWPNHGAAASARTDFRCQP